MQIKVLASLLLLMLTDVALCQKTDLAEKSLEELMQMTVSTASKHEQPVTEAPASVTVITADEIRKYGYRTLADALRSVRGFFVTYDRNYSYLGVRGFARPGDYNSRILLLVDGHRLNDNIYDQAMIGTEFPIDVDLIARIEVIRGPASSLYGSNAFFGVINVITLRGGDLRGMEMSANAGSYGTFGGHATYGNRIRDFEFLVAGSAYDSRGQNLFYSEYNTPENNYGRARHDDDDQFGDWLATIAGRGLTLQGLYSSRGKGIPTGSFASVFNDRRNRTVDGHRYFDLHYERNLGKGWQFSGRVFYDQYGYNGTYITASDDPGGVLNVDVARGEWWGTELQLERKFFHRHQVTLGTEARDNLRQFQWNFDVKPFFSYLKDERDSFIWAGYLQDEIQLTSKVLLNAGVRYDRYEHVGATANPRAALIYEPWQKTNFKLLYGTAFRSPNAYEQYYYSSGYARPAVPIRPETIRSFELVFEQKLPGRLHFTASGYHNLINDLISQEEDPITGDLVYANVEKVRARGLEFEVSGRHRSGFEGRVSYGVQETLNRTSGQLLTNSPKHMGTVNLIVPLWREKLFAGAEVQYMSSRRTLLNGGVGGHAVANLTLFNTRLLGPFDLSASLYNLFDTKYADPGGAEHLQDRLGQDARNFRVKLTWRWGQRRVGGD